MRRLAAPIVVVSVLLLSGCDMLGIESASAIAARRDAEGRAIGSGCRDAGRSIEDCFNSNRKGDKAAIFAGWRDMNDYMRDNKMDPQPAAVADAGPKDDAKDGPKDGDGDAAAKDDGKDAKAGADKTDNKVAAKKTSKADSDNGDAGDSGKSS